MKYSPVCWDYPERPAVFIKTESNITYGQLRLDVLDLAARIPVRSLLFLFGQNDYSTLVSYLACLEAGSVPLLLSPDIPTNSFDLLLKKYQPSYLILPRGHHFDVKMCDFSLIFNDYHLCSFKAESKVELHPDLALLLTTSGSTGSPKLVRLSYENLRSNISSIIESLGITQNERAITTLPFNYSYGLSIINTHLAVGASLVLTGDNFFSSDFWRQVRSLGVTSIAGVPYSYEILLKLRFQRMELGELRTLTQAGGRLTLKQAEQINEICTLKGINFYIMYGQTEASPRIAVLSPEYMPQKLGSIGKVISGGSLWIEDVDGNELQSATEVGELIYGGPNVALGYAETGEDLSRGDDWCGILRTGDIAKQDEDGFFYIIGRKHRFLKIFGNRIALDDVEAWFSNQDIVAAAYGVDDHLRVSIESKLDLKLPDIIRGLSEHLSIHQSALDISIINALPRFNSGKVDYQCLNLLS